MYSTTSRAKTRGGQEGKLPRAQRNGRVPAHQMQAPNQWLAIRGHSVMFGLTATAVTTCSNMPVLHHIHLQRTQKHTMHVQLPSSHKKACDWTCRGNEQSMPNMGSWSNGANDRQKVVHRFSGMHWGEQFLLWVVDEPVQVLTTRVNLVPIFCNSTGLFNSGG